MKYPTKNSDTVKPKAYAFSSNDQNDFETLYYDPSANGLDHGL